MLNKKNKIFLLFCKLSLTAALQVLVTYFGFIFFNNGKNGNISSLTHVFLGDIWLFLITFFMFLALTAFFLTLVSNEKNVLIRKHFLWVGFITNAIIFSSFLITVGALRSNIYVFFRVIESGIFGMLTAYFLRPILFPVKLVDPSAQI